jgi:nucleotide-binding universal stress UspA family protein
MYRHISIPTDGSELARRAVHYGLSLAKSVGAKVTALTVEGSFDVYAVPASKVYEMSISFAEHLARTKAHAEKILSGVAEESALGWCRL